jgi:hypothetical protein
VILSGYRDEKSGDPESRKNKDRWNDLPWFEKIEPANIRKENDP